MSTLCRLEPYTEDEHIPNSYVKGRQMDATERAIALGYAAAGLYGFLLMVRSKYGGAFSESERKALNQACVDAFRLNEHHNGGRDQ